MRRTSLGAKKVGVSRYEVARQNAQYLWNIFSCENRFSKYQSFSKPLCFPFPQRRLRNPSRETAKTQRRRKGQNTKEKKGPKHKGEGRDPPTTKASPMYADHDFAPGYRPLQGVRPCLKCLVGTSWCRCDVEAAERQRKRAERPSTPANDFAGFRKSVKTYSWEDGRHADHPDPHVGIYITVDEASELKKDHIDVTFSPSSVGLEIRLPNDRTYFFRRDNLYESIDPEASTWFLSKNKHRIVVKLAKSDPRKKWPGLTKVFATLQPKQNDGALDFGIAAMTGSVSHVGRRPKEVQTIVSSKREYWQGPPKYTWDKHDRKYQN